MAAWDLAVSASGVAHDMAVGITQIIGFFGDNHGDTIEVGNYQSSIHILEEIGIDNCDDHPTNQVENLQYVTDTTGQHRSGVSSGVLSLSAVEESSLFRYHFNHGSAVSTSGATYYSYDGSTPATPPVGVGTYAFEFGDSTWSSASGSAANLGLGDQGSATDHDFFVGVSATPDTVGAKSGWKLRLDMTYY